jgi:hypothetical protein
LAVSKHRCGHCRHWSIADEINSGGQVVGYSSSGSTTNAFSRTAANGYRQIVAMWRFTRNKAITEGFHTKMEVLQRQAYGFGNFQNYRMRVKALCP